MFKELFEKFKSFSLKTGDVFEYKNKKYISLMNVTFGSRLTSINVTEYETKNKKTLQIDAEKLKIFPKSKYSELYL